MKYLIYLSIAIISITSCKTVKNKEVENSASNSGDKVRTEINTQKRDADLISMGFDFVAFGNEPFWILRIDFDKSIAELEIQGEKMNTFKIVGNKNNLIEEMHFEGNSESLMINAVEQTCFDNMSGEGFAYTINIDFKGNPYTGCGKYFAEDVNVGTIDMKLFEQWQLSEFNGKPLKLGQKPFIKLSSKERKINGFSSCNNFNGTYILEGNKLRFSKLALTRMFCPESIEVDFMQALNQVRSYFITDNTLVLLDSEQAELLKFIISS